MNKKMLFAMVIFGMYVIPMSNMFDPAHVWAEEEKLMPMELEGTEWSVTMTYVTPKGKKEVSEDKLIFTNKKFISEGFESKGYDPTNYSLILQEDGSTQFGTMQIKGKDTSFWKGVLSDDIIDGSVHTQFNEGKSTRTTYFKGNLITGELKRRAERPMAPPPAPAPVDQPVAPESEAVDPFDLEAENAQMEAQSNAIESLEESQDVVEE